MKHGITPFHPGRALLSRLHTGLSPVLLAMALRVPTIWITETIAGRRAVGQSLANKLGDYFGNGSEWWLREQHLYDASRQQECHKDVAEVRSLAEFVRFEDRIRNFSRFSLPKAQPKEVGGPKF